ncbi:hypothetical protein SELMODRAFT_38778, partial [Selaginella moellendorffii]
PAPEHWSCVADMLGRAGLLSQAEEIIEAMLGSPDSVVLRALLSACSVHRDVARGARTAEMDSSASDGGAHILMSNIYMDN